VESYPLFAPPCNGSLAPCGWSARTLSTSWRVSTKSERIDPLARERAPALEAEPVVLRSSAVRPVAATLTVDQRALRTGCRMHVGRSRASATGRKAPESREQGRSSVFHHSFHLRSPARLWLRNGNRPHVRPAAPSAQPRCREPHVGPGRRGAAPEQLTNWFEARARVRAPHSRSET
jgi:hypothetical protein